MGIRETLVEIYGDIPLLCADGFDDAIIGVEEGSSVFRVIYSVSKCIEILIAQGMNFEEANEYFEYNVEGSYVGEQTPIWCHDDFIIWADESGTEN